MTICSYTDRLPRKINRFKNNRLLGMKESTVPADKNVFVMGVY